jgi:hypothetical protein
LLREADAFLAAYAIRDIGYGNGAPENLDGNRNFGLVAFDLDTRFALVLLVKC